MSMTAPAAPSLLRTLAPALRRLHERLREWRAAPRVTPLSTLKQGTLDGLEQDLLRQAAELDVDRPVLVIMLMGGTGVGKSSLLNALARGEVAQASFARPTTREPVVYYHESVRPDHLARPLQECRLIVHDRPELAQKILVDTPDLDSNEPENRERLQQLLPVADVVLYVGSQEKYHDQLGWEMFLEQRRRRAFAFVLNKWDRCLHGVGASGLRPDEDLLQDLQAQGFHEPLLFRTCAQAWIEANGQPPQLPEGEQFRELENWLELGLTRLEIEAIKARGVGQLLLQLRETLENTRPPELSEAAHDCQKSWRAALEEEARVQSDILLAAVDPFQREIEQHFSLEGHRRFRGLMSAFMHVATRIRYLGATLRSQLPRPLRSDLKNNDQASAWNLATFSQACAALASDRHLDARGRALPHQLLVQADQQGFPVAYLHEVTEAASRLDWRQRFTNLLIEVLQEVETQWARPAGSRRGLQTIFVWLSDILPIGILLLSLVYVLNNYFQFWPQERLLNSLWEAVLLPVVSVFFTLLLLYILIVLILPIRWPAIRGTFHRRLTERVSEELRSAYLPLPQDVAARLLNERRHTDRLVEDCAEVIGFLRSREQAASIAPLYGDGDK